jgi:hypothetical protein
MNGLLKLAIDGYGGGVHQDDPRRAVGRVPGRLLGSRHLPGGGVRARRKLSDWDAA